MPLIKYSLIVPVYNNEKNLPDLLNALQEISSALNNELEVILVIDGSPDQSQYFLEQHLPSMPFESQLLLHSRNFGAFSAIRTGLMHANGHYCAVMAADLQEPPSLIIAMFHSFEKGDCDVVIACRDKRNDPLVSRFFSAIFWWVYRVFVIAEIPAGGVGTIACTDKFKNQLLALEEKESSMVGLIFWLGFRRKEVFYVRQKRAVGKSGWSVAKKLNYFFDSIFSFSDLPIKILLAIGLGGFLISVILGGGLLINRLAGVILPVPGYVATMLAILFFGCINIIAVGIVGAYVWRAFSNTQRRPPAIVMESKRFPNSNLPS